MHSQSENQVTILLMSKLTKLSLGINVTLSSWVKFQCIIIIITLRISREGQENAFAILDEVDVINYDGKLCCRLIMHTEVMVNSQLCWSAAKDQI